MSNPLLAINIMIQRLVAVGGATAPTNTHDHNFYVFVFCVFIINNILTLFARDFIRWIYTIIVDDDDVDNDDYAIGCIPIRVPVRAFFTREFTTMCSVTCVGLEHRSLSMCLLREMSVKYSEIFRVVAVVDVVAVVEIINRSMLSRRELCDKCRVCSLQQNMVFAFGRCE